MPEKYVALAPDGPHEAMIPVAVSGFDALSSLSMVAGRKYAVVPDVSSQAGVGETLANSLVERGLCVFVADDPAPPPALVADTTPPPGPIVTTAPPLVAIEAHFNEVENHEG